MPADATGRPLWGRAVATTRERAGRLDARLARLGADVIHVPLIRTSDPADGGAALADALDDLSRYDWIVVTSPTGAERVLPGLAGAPCRIGVVGTRTAAVAERVTGRAVDVIPARQTAADLAASMPDPDDRPRLLLAQADRADPASAARFAARGYDVTSVTAYRTELRAPSWQERRAALRADVVAFASGSAVLAWREAFGSERPVRVVSIGPATTSVAEACGVEVDVTATDHSIEGLAAAIVVAVGTGS
jgi:uroporphyrinogen-III synthase